MNFSSIKTKFLVLIISLIIIVSGALTYFFLKQSNELLQSELKERGIVLARYLETISEESIANRNIFKTLDPLVQSLAQAPDVSYVVILTPSGEVLA
ncbi:MAG: hypothetical protein AAB019_01465, partial [Planctomycetota bacterium]